MVEEENGLIVNDEGELLIHEDSIIETTEMSAEELAVLQASKMQQNSFKNYKEKSLQTELPLQD